MSPFGQNCMTMGKPFSTVNSRIILTAKQVDSAQVKAEFRLTIPGSPEPLCV